MLGMLLRNVDRVKFLYSKGCFFCLVDFFRDKSNVNYLLDMGSLIVFFAKTLNRAIWLVALFDAVFS